MMIVKLLRYGRGYVEFTATGVFLERFMNLAVRGGVNIWDAVKHDDKLTARTDAASYRSLRVFAKKTGVRLRVGERHGAPFQARRYRKRLGLLLGLLFFLAFLGVMGQFIWHIEVVGNEAISREQILTEMNGLGLKTGVWKRSLDARTLERYALLRMQQLSWIAVNIDGSTATVEVRERVMPPPMFPDNDKPCNIVAARDGLILSMEVYEGQSVLQPGNTVQAGDVLVSGIVEDKKGQDTYKHSRAKIIAQADVELRVETPMTVRVKIMTGEQKHRNYLRVFGAELPLFLYRPFTVAYDLTREEKPLSPPFFSLPLVYISETYDFYVSQTRALTTQEAREKALALLAEREKTELAGAELVERTLEEREEDGVYFITARYLCNLDIAQEQEILINP